ncbi:MAG: hypothetical protein AMXMBFR23_28130 [Chloroflexota bacterium]
MASDMVTRTDVGTPSTGTARMRLRRAAVAGPRCPHCAGPLVFGEGCSLCPICGYSGCSV